MNRTTHLATINLVALASAIACAPEPREEVIAIVDEAAADAGQDQRPDGRPGPGEDRRVEVFAGEHVYWSGWDEGQNRREVDVEVTLPGAGASYASVELDFALRCPNQTRCDWWDRLGSFGLVERAGREDERYIELSRFITPYRVGASWRVDLTDLRPLLQGDVTFRVFIDTWVGPGHQNGDGWLVDASLDYVGGVPERPVVDASPVLAMTRVDVGDPESSIEAQLGELGGEVAEGASRSALRVFITGHGQGNLDNCAEFCPQFHVFEVDGVEHRDLVWRTDCDSSVPQDQLGNVTSPRAGWCPGGEARDWTIDLGATGGDRELDITYTTSPYENTCRPEADTCEGCAFDQGCAWNDSNHTRPNYQVSALLISYE